jgi:hypothetical protein
MMKAAPYLCVITLLLCSTRGEATTKVVLQGTPLYKVVIKPNMVFSEAVPIDKQSQYRTLVTHESTTDKYVWVSREDHSLVPVQSGAFVNFIAPETGWLRVGDVDEMRGMLEAALSMRKGDLTEEEMRAAYWDALKLDVKEMRAAPYAYIEVLFSAFGIVMYYGIAEEFDP